MMATKKNKKQQPVLKLRIKGPAIGQSRIPIPELLRICCQVQAAINRQAEAMEGGHTLRTGPVLSKVKEECTLELIGIETGSATLKFGFARSQIQLPYPDALPAGNAAIAGVAAAVKSLATVANCTLILGFLRALTTWFDLGPTYCLRDRLYRAASG